ncbi:sulfatase-like hydrolase/transferase [Sphingosinicella sp. BN140058]|uniref:sulfatase-like hydrolase/transferase n=1 Tax=Sphingosinicella sp. BN140058 TaxID=1892855 RepID=UPI001012FA5E|nr:sulfatase-like hydrolase/transferase [Sphingosinicella sp. BN140058]QAY75113.1 hypothetical protein ETR14_00130 [Sphingosinicella sp. BN140058]
MKGTRFVAMGLIAAYVVQSAFRLAALSPLYHYGRGSVPFHAAALLLASLAGGWMLIRVRGRPGGQLLVALLLAAFWTLLILFDVVAFVTAPRFHTAMPLQTVAEFYCGGAAERCAEARPGVVALVGTIAAALAFLIWFSADALAGFAQSVAKRVAGTWSARRVPLRPVLLLFALLYAAPWLLLPGQAANREPLVGFLKPVEFTAGPRELLTRQRPQHRLAATAAARPRTLVLITVDSLRADAVELRPGRASLTPFLQGLASAGKLHDLGPATAVCANSYCGIIALQSGSDWAALQDGPPLTLPDVLAANGYRSHFLLSGPHREDMNLGELYGPNIATFLDDASEDSVGLGDDREQVRRLAALPIHDPARTYLSIHLMSAHRAGFRFSSAREEATLWRALFGAGSPRDNAAFYRSGVRQADWIIGRVFATLAQRGLLADAVVVITADHGERYAKGQRPGHGVPLDPDVAAIPLLVYDSRAGAWPRQTSASQIDVAPTLLAAAGIERPSWWRGSPLQHPLQRRGAPMDTLHASALVGTVGGRQVMIRCATRTGGTKILGMDHKPVPPALAAAALAAAPALHHGLAARTDAGRCFR